MHRNTCSLRACTFSDIELEVAGELAHLFCRNHFIYVLSPELLGTGHTSFCHHLFQKTGSLKSPWRLAEPFSREAAWMPPLDSVSPLSGTRWLSRDSAGSQNPSHFLHQSPQMACSMEHTLMKRGIRKGKKPPGAVCHQIVCPSVLILLMDVLLSKSIQTVKEAFSTCPRGTLVSADACSLIEPSFLFLAELESS